MKQKIRIGIVGYGNLGKGAEIAVSQTPDMELVAVFSRRKLSKTQSGVPAILLDEAEKYSDKIDVMLLCGGSATDLIEQGPRFSALFNTVDSFDTHAKIPEYFTTMDTAAKGAGKVATISIGWDPGLFSLNRLLGNAVLPQGKDYTFWRTQSIRQKKHIAATVMLWLNRGQILPSLKRQLKLCLIILLVTRLPLPFYLRPNFSPATLESRMEELFSAPGKPVPELDM
ncbi:MAG: diaminopimelate dehydrogenase [Anaerospora sp.]|nr:diaminopimelate dehydrogenase [Anaerospora sp.]